MRSNSWQWITIEPIFIECLALAFDCIFIKGRSAPQFPAPQLTLAIAAWRMNYLFIDLRHAIERNSLSLLNGEWMVCWFQFNEWPDAIAKMDHRLQIQGVRINPDVRTQPSEKRSVPRSVGLVVEFQEMEEVLLTERRPHTPREGFLGPSDRYFKTSTHKEGVVIDHARIRSQN